MGFWFCFTSSSSQESLDVESSEKSFVCSFWRKEGTLNGLYHTKQSTSHKLAKKDTLYFNAIIYALFLDRREHFHTFKLSKFKSL